MAHLRALTLIVIATWDVCSEVALTHYNFQAEKGDAVFCTLVGFRLFDKSTLASKTIHPCAVTLVHCTELTI